MPGTFFGIPTARIDPSFLAGFVDTARETSGDFAAASGVLPGPRNVLTAKAMARGAEFLLMQDDDVTVSSGAVQNLKQVMALHPRAALAAALVLRGEHLPNAWLEHPEDKSACPIIGQIPMGPFPVLCIGAAFCLIRLEAVRQLDTPWWRFDLVTGPNGEKAQRSEDVDFCYRLRDRGWEIYADPRISTSHLKQGYTLRFDRDTWESGAWWNKHINIDGINCLPAGNQLGHGG